MKLNNIKDQMGKREIAPSAHAWEKLQARLDEKPASNKTWMYWVSGIAAALLLGFFLFPMLTTTTVVAPDNQVVIEETKTEIKTNIITPETAQEEIAVVEETQVINENSESSPAIQNKPVTNKVAIVKETIVATSPNSKKQNVANNEPFIDQPVVNNIEETIVATTTTSPPVIVEQPEKEKLTAAQEADLLLQKALGNQPKNDAVATKTVDPKMLLMETEWDVESDRRNRIQNTIQDGLNFLKTEAVALIDK